MPSLSFIRDLKSIGIKVEPEKSKTKDRFVQIDVREDLEVNKFVNDYVADELEIKRLEARASERDVEIMAAAMEHALDTKSFQALQLIGTKGSIKVIPQERYNPKDIKGFRQALKKYGLEPKKYLKRELVAEFAYNEMTPGERELLVEFMKEQLGSARVAEIVSEREVYTVSGLQDDLLKAAKDQEDLTELRKACGHYQPAIKVDGKSAPLATGVVKGKKK